MTKFTENLWDDLAREHGADLAPPGSARLRTRRPGVIAGSTLVLAVGGTALALGLTSTGGTPASTGSTKITTAAYTITKATSGAVTVQFAQNPKSTMESANAQLTAMGIKEQFYVWMGSGPAPVKGAVACSQSPNYPKVSGPPIKVLLGTEGTQVIKPGTTPDNTGLGTWYIAHCYVYPTGGRATSNSGVGG